MRLHERSVVAKTLETETLFGFCRLLSMLQILLVMEQRTLKDVNHCLNTNIYSCLQTFGGDLYLNVVHFFNASVVA
jgi:hypothetical protein